MVSSRGLGDVYKRQTMGKELAVLAHRLMRQLKRIQKDEYLGKINGATGTFGAHLAAVPEADWLEISQSFVEGLGLTWNPLTTQIESHDWQAEIYADIARYNRVLHNPVSYTHLTLPTIHVECRSRWSPYH